TRDRTSGSDPRWTHISTEKRDRCLQQMPGRRRRLHSPDRRRWWALRGCPHPADDARTESAPPPRHTPTANRYRCSANTEAKEGPDSVRVQGASDPDDFGPSPRFDRRIHGCRHDIIDRKGRRFTQGTGLAIPGEPAAAVAHHTGFDERTRHHELLDGVGVA